MNTIIETPRFIIRQIENIDVRGMYLLDSDADVHKYLGNKPIKFIDEANQMIDFIRKQYDEYGIGRWAIIDKNTNEFIGWTGFKYITSQVNGHSDFHDFGYRIQSKYWGKGIATESALACLEYAAQNLNFPKLYAIASIDNVASNKILQKVGFIFDGSFVYSDDTICNWYEYRQ